jgi:hypothetical protein
LRIIDVRAGFKIKPSIAAYRAGGDGNKFDDLPPSHVAPSWAASVGGPLSFLPNSDNIPAVVLHIQCAKQRWAFVERLLAVLHSSCQPGQGDPYKIKGTKNVV